MNKDPSSPVSKTPNDKVDGDWKVVGKGGGIPKHAENLHHPPQRCTSPRKEKKRQANSIEEAIGYQEHGPSPWRVRTSPTNRHPPFAICTISPPKKDDKTQPKSVSRTQFSLSPEPTSKKKSPTPTPSTKLTSLTPSLLPQAESQLMVKNKKPR